MGLLERERLFFTQKAKLIELTNEYAVRDEDGIRSGWCVKRAKPR